MGSKKRSATKPPPEPVVYFIDRSLGRTAGLVLRDAGATVELHDDHFAQDTPDAELLPKVGERGWLFITKDKRIRYSVLEREAVIKSNLRVFVLAGGNLSGEQMGTLLLSNRAKIERLARKQKPPFIAGIYESGVRLYELAQVDDADE